MTPLGEPSALPMLARCFRAAWRGCSEGERLRLNEAWSAARLSAAQPLKAGCVSQVDTPIWSVFSPMGQTLTLISVKDDYTREIP